MERGDDRLRFRRLRRLLRSQCALLLAQADNIALELTVSLLQIGDTSLERCNELRRFRLSRRCRQLLGYRLRRYGLRRYRLRRERLHGYRLHKNT
jgi:hypothetical protein